MKLRYINLSFEAVKLAHPDWLAVAADRWTSSYRLYEEEKLPRVLEARMLLCPLRHALRGVFGSDLRAAWWLLRKALLEKLADWMWSVHRVWHTKILLKTYSDYDALVDAEVEKVKESL